MHDDADRNVTIHDYGHVDENMTGCGHADSDEHQRSEQRIVPRTNARKRSTAYVWRTGQEKSGGDDDHDPSVPRAADLLYTQ